MTDSRAHAALPFELDLASIAAQLRAGRTTPAFMEHWLRRTWSDRDGYMRALYRAAARKYPAIMGRPELGLDLYADCVTAQLGHNRTALVTYKDGQVIETSYEWLHLRCSALTSVWQSAGVSAGAALVIVAPIGLDYAVALLTALRLGLTVTLLSPLGPAYVRNRIAALAPDYVATSERWQHLLAPNAEPPLPMHARGGDSTVASSHTYTADAVPLRLLSPFGGAELIPRELSAAELHASLLRDSLLIFALEPGDRFAAPGFDPLQWQPLAFLSALLSGATWVELDPKDLALQPRLLKQIGVTLLGVDTQLRDLVLTLGPELCHGVRSWFRSLNDTFDYVAWDQLQKLLAERKQSGFSVLSNAASGGAHLFSPRSEDQAVTRVWPAPGREFVIAGVGADVLPSLNETGVYVPLQDAQADTSLLRMVVAKLEAGWTLGGAIDLGPQGRSLPTAEMAASARRHPRVAAASVVVVPGRWPNAAHVILLAFTSEANTQGIATSDIKQLVSHDLGSIHQPDHIELFALYPRSNERWCSSQYLSGTLGKKSRIPLFLTLSRLSWIFDPARL
jgi:hypothetical protein